MWKLIVPKLWCCDNHGNKYYFLGLNGYQQSKFVPVKPQIITSNPIHRCWVTQSTQTSANGDTTLKYIKKTPWLLYVKDMKSIIHHNINQGGDVVAPMRIRWASIVFWDHMDIIIPTFAFQSLESHFQPKWYCNFNHDISYLEHKYKNQWLLQCAEYVKLIVPRMWCCDNHEDAVERVLFFGTKWVSETQTSPWGGHPLACTHRKHPYCMYYN